MTMEPMEHKEVLTVRRLIDDLSRIDMDAEVQVGIRHIEMTVPIGGLMQGTYEQGPVAILVVDPYKVKAAFDFAMAQDKEKLRTIQDAMIVDSEGQKLIN